jgi:tetratricopeptide (TPR) repeat protein
VRPQADPSVRSVVRRARGSAAALALALALATTLGEREARGDSISDLEKAHNAYVAHKYDDAATRLRALLDPRTGTLKEPDNVADARMYLGAAMLALGKKADAEAVFEQLLRDKPDYQPDPLRVSLQATDALIDVRSRMREELAASMAERVRQAQEEKAKADAERQKGALRLAMLEKLASEETIVRINSRWVGALPFGVGQFQNGQTALGWAFLSTESLLLAGSGIGQLVTLYNEGQARDAVASNAGTQYQYQGRAHDAYVAANVFTAGFALVAIAGIVHAQLTFVPERTQIRQRDLPPISFAPLVLPLVGARESGQRERPVGVALGVLGQF